MKVVTEWFGHDMATALKHYHQVMPADFARAREQDPFKQPEKVTPKATPALPRMGENGQAPIKKGIENTVEHGSYQCLMTPTGLESLRVLSRDLLALCDLPESMTTHMTTSVPSDNDQAIVQAGEAFSRLREQVGSVRMDDAALVNN